MAIGDNRHSGRALMPASTRTQARVILYQPTQRPTTRTGEWQSTTWGRGRVRVTGRLGQRHADMLEALCSMALDVRPVSDGGVEMLVDPHRVRRAMAGGKGQYSAEQMMTLLADLRAAVIEIETPELAARGERVIGGLVDHWVPSSRAVRDPLHGDRRLWRVRLGVALVALLKVDALVWRDPAPIAALRSGVSQALARHVLTHANTPRGGWRLDGLLSAVGVPTKTATRKARMAVRRDADGLARIGIHLTAGGSRVSLRCEAEAASGQH